MFVTVAICTHNRCEDLVEAIESIMKQNYPPQSFELLIIDNRSNDQTPQIGLEFTEKYSNVRYIFEETLGLSYARNRAMEEAKGEIIAYLDDDAIANPEWINEISKTFANQYVGCVGGRIFPIWETAEPTWLPETFRTVYTILDYSKDIKEMKYPDIPFGANMAFQKRLLKEFGGFRTDLGRKGTNLLSNEESEVMKKIGNDYKVIYNPNIIVQHKIPAKRSNKRWFVRRFFWAGISDSLEAKNKLLFFSKSVVKIVYCSLRLLVSFKSQKKVMYELARISHGAGSINGLFKR